MNEFRDVKGRFIPLIEKRKLFLNLYGKLQRRDIIKALDISSSTVSEWRKEYKLPTYKELGIRWRLSIETRNKMSVAKQGKHPIYSFPKGHKINLGRVPWNKGLPKEMQPAYGRHYTEELKEKIRLSNLGKKRSDKTKRKMLNNKNWINILPKMHERRRGKTYEEIYGVERAKKLRYKKRLERLGKKLEEICGVKRALEIKRKFKENRLKMVIPRKDTSIEKFLQNELVKNNVKFETHKAITGQPDIFIDPNICIFADGDYWHNIAKVRERDIKVNNILKTENYIVLRFWEHEIKNNLDNCIEKILGVVNGR